MRLTCEYARRATIIAIESGLWNGIRVTLASGGHGMPDVFNVRGEIRRSATGNLQRDA
jgi:hypothetical protein